MNAYEKSLTPELTEPVTIGPEAYVSEAYAKAEPDKLWRKVWQVACRVEEIPKVGDYVVYDILDDTIIVTRSGPDEISAFHNVCAHRGKRIAEGCGHARLFRCSYHAWQYNLKGENIFVLDKTDWKGALSQQRLSLPPVKVASWGGWVWINLDPDAMPLRDYLEPAATMLDPFELEKMRYKWRMWCYFPSNWKTALEAFLEPYHVEGTHPQLIQFASYYAWSKQQGLHSNSGQGAPPSDAPRTRLDRSFNNTLMRPGKGADPRASIAELQEEVWRTTLGTTTQVFVDAAKRLVDELPEGTPPDEVVAYWMASAKRDDAARGVIWPEIDPEHVGKAGSSWHLFPNMNVIQSFNNAMYYRVRPHGFDPNQCIFEAVGLERFPEGEEPETEWVFADSETGRDQWPPILLQDFDNMGAVQKGMRASGFRGAVPNPQQERKITTFHRSLAQFMGTGAPVPLDLSTKV